MTESVIDTLKASVTKFTTPNGEEMAIVPHQALLDVIQSAIYAQDIADYYSGKIEGLSSDEMRDYLAAPTPLAFWRKRRGLTQAALAEKAGTTQSYIADLEKAKRGGSVEIMARIAKALRVRLDDLAFGQESD